MKKLLRMLLAAAITATLVLAVCRVVELEKLLSGESGSSYITLYPIPAAIVFLLMGEFGLYLCLAYYLAEPNKTLARSVICALLLISSLAAGAVAACFIWDLDPYPGVISTKAVSILSLALMAAEPLLIILHAVLNRRKA